MLLISYASIHSAWRLTDETAWEVLALCLLFAIFFWVFTRYRASTAVKLSLFVAFAASIALTSNPDTAWASVYIPLAASAQAAALFSVAFQLMTDLRWKKSLLEVAQKKAQVLEAENQRAHHQLDSLKEQLRRGDRLSTLGELTASVAHDLSNAFVPIMAFSGIVKEHELPKKHVEQFRGLQLGIEHASRILRVVKGLDSGTNIGSVSLADVIQQAAELTRFRWETDAKRLAQKFDVQFSLNRKCRIRGVASDFVQVAVNLIINAVEAMPSGGRIVITVAPTHNGSRITISDNGRGMSAEELEKCFDTFYTTKRSGSGLGLASCKRIIESYAGTIQAQSNPSGGTSIAICLPADDGIESVTVNSRVLVVEPNETAQRSLGNLIESFGFQVDTAASGDQATALASEASFRVAVLDYGLGDPGAVEIFQTLRNRFPDIVILVVTGWSKDLVWQGFSKSKVRPDMILEKPIERQSLDHFLRLFGLLAE